MRLIEKLQREKPKKNVLFIAIEELTDPKDIDQFYQEYVEYLRKNGTNKETRNNPEIVANENISYAVRYYWLVDK